MMNWTNQKIYDIQLLGNIMATEANAICKTVTSILNLT